MTETPTAQPAPSSLATRVLIGLVLGLIVGLVLSPAESGVAATLVMWVEPVGALWVNAIRMTVVPLLVALLIGGVAGAGQGSVARVGGGALAWFVGLIGVSAAIGGIFPNNPYWRAFEVAFPERFCIKDLYTGEIDEERWQR